jgi:LmbE family N-acetylglucosaminyl deacetylase
MKERTMALLVRVVFGTLLMVVQLFGGSGLAGTIIVMAPHPDDAEASCGGLVANAIAAGDTVIVLTMTGGELGIWGKSPEEARAIRTAEARDAAALLGARAVFFGGIDGSLTADSAMAARLKQILLSVHPTIVLAPWPLDVHPDHQATGMLAWRIFHDQSMSFELFFYETSNSPHTKSFQFEPTDYVDITKVLKKKQAALYRQASQHPEEWWGMYENMAVVNGYAADVPYAEAYVRARTSSGMGGRAGRTRTTLD